MGQAQLSCVVTSNGALRRASHNGQWRTTVAPPTAPTPFCLQGRSETQTNSCSSRTSSPPGVPAQPSADAVAALAAGLLPCVTRQVTRMGAGSDGGLVWFRPSTFAATLPCWKQVLLFGPLGQVGTRETRGNGARRQGFTGTHMPAREEEVS